MLFFPEACERSFRTAILYKWDQIIWVDPFHLLPYMTLFVWTQHNSGLQHVWTSMYDWAVRQPWKQVFSEVGWKGNASCPMNCFSWEGSRRWGGLMRRSFMPAVMGSQHWNTDTSWQAHPIFLVLWIMAGFQGPRRLVCSAEIMQALVWVYLWRPKQVSSILPMLPERTGICLSISGNPNYILDLWACFDKYHLRSVNFAAASVKE